MFDMDSVPPAMTREVVPVRIDWAARMVDLMEEAQTLFIVVATVEWGRPALRAHWRAGFWPRLWGWWLAQYGLLHLCR